MGDYVMLFLSNHLLESLLKYLRISDLLELSKTCKVFKQIFNDDRIWEKVYNKFFSQHVEDESLIRHYEFKDICRNIYIANICESDVEKEFLNQFLQQISYKSTEGTKPKYRRQNKFTTEKSISDNNLLQGSSSHFKIIRAHHHQPKSESNLLSNLSKNSSSCNLFVDKNGPDTQADANNDLEFPVDFKNCKKRRPLRLRGRSYNAAMRRRLQRLVEYSKRFPLDPDDCVPGDKTIKYQLKYRSE